MSRPTYDISLMETVRSDLGDGGWSIHVLRTDLDQDDERAWPIVASGTAELADDGGWTRPNEDDWSAARKTALALASDVEEES